MATKNTVVLQPLLRNKESSLVEQIVQLVSTRIEEKLLRIGTRMPSIRQSATEHQVSRFTVVEAYDRLVAMGHLESRRGSGFFVREGAPLLATSVASTEPATAPALDVVWLVRNMFRQLPQEKMPCSGMLPKDWLDGGLVANALRGISRQNSDLFLHYGIPQGFLPLRQQLQLKLAELEIAATPEQILTTTGVTQGLDLVAREFTKAGDTVFVDDPAWFLMFGSFAIQGVKVIGIPRLHDGPDIALLNELATLHRPKLYIISSVVHNPTSTSLSAAKAFQVLKAAELHDFIVVEDDVYCDIHLPGAAHSATRVASLDQLKRVIYLGGFSKTLAGSLRVGFIATSRETAGRLTDRKMLASLTTAEIGERVVYKVLSEGHYRKHVDRIRHRLEPLRGKIIRQLEQVHIQLAHPAAAGMFLWTETRRDTSAMTERALQQGIFLAPGSLFSPNQLPSTKMRVNIATMSDPDVWKFLQRELG